MRVRRAEAPGATWEPPRPVSVFVSSTFRDMQLERDAIHSTVLPRLRELADAYGTDVSVIDLRWGVDTSGTTEAEQERKVVRACLGEIDRCEPFFLSLVGERYGYVLPDDSLAGLLRTRLGLPAGRSITELEILHAVQRFGESETCLHLVRTISNAGGLSGSLHTEFLSEGGDADRQRRLREMLSRRFPDSTLPYVVSLAPDGTYDLDGFCELLYGELSSRLERLWGPPPQDGANPWEREHGLQWRAAEDAAATFAAREHELTKLLDFCDPARPQAASTLVVRGTEGSGVTTLLSRMAVEARDAHPELCVAFLSCGLTQRSSTTVGALRFLATDLFELSGLGEKGLGFDDLLGSRAEKDADDERFELGVLTNVLLLAARKRRPHRHRARQPAEQPHEEGDALGGIHRGGREGHLRRGIDPLGLGAQVHEVHGRKVEHQRARAVEEADADVERGEQKGPEHDVAAQGMGDAGARRPEALALEDGRQEAREEQQRPRRPQPEPGRDGRGERKGACHQQEVGKHPILRHQDPNHGG